MKEFYAGFGLGVAIGGVAMMAFLAFVDRLLEWASGGARARAKEVFDAKRQAEIWRNRYTREFEAKGIAE